MRFPFFLSLNSRLTIDRNSLSAWVWSLADSRKRSNCWRSPSRENLLGWGSQWGWHPFKSVPGNPRSCTVTKFSRRSPGWRGERSSIAPALQELTIGGAGQGPAPRSIPAPRPERGSPVLCWMHYVRQGSAGSPWYKHSCGRAVHTQPERRLGHGGRLGRSWALRAALLAAGRAPLKVLLLPDMLWFLWDAWDRHQTLTWGTRIGMRIGAKWKGFCLRWERR